MLDKSRAADSGVKLEVNGKILDSCTDLMMAIRNLVKKSRLMQTEIVAQGKVSRPFIFRTEILMNTSQISIKLYSMLI